MGTLRFEIVEEQLSKKFSSVKELSILIGVDSFAYMVNDENLYIQILKEYTFKPLQPGQNWGDIIAPILEKDKHLRASFNHIWLGIDHQIATLVPNRLYRSDEKMAYLDNLAVLTERDELVSDDMPYLSAKLIYPFDQTLHALFKKTFPGYRSYHLVTTLVKALRPHTAKQNGYHLFVLFHSQSIRVMLFDKNDLLFINYFTFKSASDVVYYIMMIIDQFSLSTIELPVYLAGQLLKDSEIYRLLCRYLNAVRFMEVPPQFELGNHLGRYPEYFFYDLLSLRLGD
ncbi:MAG: hypothetical protein DHS20C18_19690 [Saprospiraceae bacterium]|nr:MAG: hypothetical protein DHS20C18_19690 [Saprospiraceae bacterium]